MPKDALIKNLTVIKISQQNILNKFISIYLKISMIWLNWQESQVTKVTKADLYQLHNPFTFKEVEK